MLPSLDSIKQNRLKLNITQQKLATLTGVSKSMINQIESGRSKPSYDTARKIFEVLGTLEGESSKRAGDICSKGIVKLKTTNSLHDAIKKMQSASISQIPVFDGHEIVGIITEESLVRHVLDIDIDQRKQIKIKDVLEPRPPVVDYNTPASSLVSLIRFSKCILVSRNNKVFGIITASDTLKMME